MARRNFGASSFSGSGFGGDSGDVNPMSFMGNLMDVMLVFACGLLLALIVHWNVNLDAGSDLPDQNVSELSGSASEATTSIDLSSGEYESLGTVYRDAETGDLYLVEGNGSQS